MKLKYKLILLAYYCLTTTIISASSNVFLTYDCNKCKERGGRLCLGSVVTSTCCDPKDTTVHSNHICYDEHLES